LGGIPPRTGSVSSRVEFEMMFRDVSVGSARVVVRWRPAYVRRREDAGSEVRRARSWRRVLMVVVGGMARGIAVIVLAGCNSNCEWL